MKFPWCIARIVLNSYQRFDLGPFLWCCNYCLFSKLFRNMQKLISGVNLLWL